MLCMLMAHILKLRQLRKQLLAPIPKDYERRLGLVKRQHVVVTCDEAGVLHVSVLEDYLRARPVRR